MPIICKTSRPVLLAAALCTLASAALPPQEKTPKAVENWPNPHPNFVFGQVSAVAPDGTGQVFVFHRGARPIAVFNRDGKLIRTFGDGLISKAHGLRIDSQSNVWVTDVGNHTVRKFSNAGELQMTLGTEGQAGSASEQFDQPSDIAFAPNGDFYIADGYGNSRVVKYSREGKYIKEWGKKGTGQSEFQVVHAVVVDRHGTVYVGDRENDRIQIFDGDGNYQGKWDSFGAPFGLYHDRRSDRFLIADGRAHRCLILDARGSVVSRWGEQGQEPGQFDLPHSISMDNDGAIYVSEITGKRVQKFRP